MGPGGPQKQDDPVIRINTQLPAAGQTVNHVGIKPGFIPGMGDHNAAEFFRQGQVGDQPSVGQGDQAFGKPGPGLLKGNVQVRKRAALEITDGQPGTLFEKRELVIVDIDKQGPVLTCLDHQSHLHGRKPGFAGNDNIGLDAGSCFFKGAQKPGKIIPRQGQHRDPGVPQRGPDPGVVSAELRAQQHHVKIPRQGFRQQIGPAQGVVPHIPGDHRHSQVVAPPGIRCGRYRKPRVTGGPESRHCGLFIGLEKVILMKNTADMVGGRGPVFAQGRQGGHADKGVSHDPAVGVHQGGKLLLDLGHPPGKLVPFLFQAIPGKAHGLYLLFQGLDLLIKMIDFALSLQEFLFRGLAVLAPLLLELMDFQPVFFDLRRKPFCLVPGFGFQSFQRFSFGFQGLLQLAAVLLMGFGFPTQAIFQAFDFPIVFLDGDDLFETGFFQAVHQFPAGFRQRQVLDEPIECRVLFPHVGRKENSQAVKHVKGNQFQFQGRFPHEILHRGQNPVADIVGIAGIAQMRIKPAVFHQIDAVGIKSFSGIRHAPGFRDGLRVVVHVPAGIGPGHVMHKYQGETRAGLLDQFEFMVYRIPVVIPVDKNGVHGADHGKGAETHALIEHKGIGVSAFEILRIELGKGINHMRPGSALAAPVQEMTGVVAVIRSDFHDFSGCYNLKKRLDDDLPEWVHAMTAAMVD